MMIQPPNETPTREYRATRKPLISKIEFLDPESGKLIQRNVNIAVQSDRNQLMKLIIWAANNLVELRITNKP